MNNEGHLSDAELLDLDRVKSLGPLFEQARVHLAECSQCRRLRLEAEALRALALESAPELPRQALRAAFKGVRRSEVEERLKEGAGEDAAREILLAASRGRGEKQSPAGLYALLALASLAGLWWFSQRQPAPAVPDPSTLPFEFQPTPGEEALPRLAPEEALEDRAIESEARRLVSEHLRKEDPSFASAEIPVRTPVGVAPGPAPAPASTGTQGATGPVPAGPLPSPTFGTAAPAPSPAGSGRGAQAAAAPLSTPAGPAAPGPAAQSTAQPALDALPPPSMRAESTRFRPGQGAASFRLYFPENGSLEIRIFDGAGKSVRVLTEGNAGPGGLSYAFDGSGTDGALLPAGTYFARVMTRWFSRVETLELLP